LEVESTLIAPHDPASLYCRFIDTVLNRRKLDHLDHFLAAEVVDHAPDQTVGIVAARQTLAASLEDFSNLRVSIEDLVVDGDHLMARLTGTAIHTGPLGRLAPTRKRVSMPMFEAWVVQSDRCTQRWLCVDGHQLERSLGVQLRGPARRRTTVSGVQPPLI
jgi:predicted ester cyclase